MRNIITVDKQQVAILDITGVVSFYQLNQYKRQWAIENKIPMGFKQRGIGCVYTKPAEGLPKWKPKN